MFWWTRASKLRFPAEHGSRDEIMFEVIASSIFGCSGPELPMQVVQPYPTI